VIVTVDGLEAACDSLKCSYNYVEPASSVTGFTLTDGSLEITGTGFTREIRMITFSNEPCLNVIVVSDTSIQCTVVPVAGDWQPVVIDAYGLIPTTTDAQIHVPLIVTSVSPSVDLNPFGDTELTIQGVNFP